MTPFLQQVAEHYFAKGDIERMCFIFPNRRAKSFFRKWLGVCVAADGSKPVTAPAMFTMNDFFYRLAAEEATDRVQLLLELYDRYKVLVPKPESLDDFIFWGDVLLADFDDVDKYLVRAEGLFANVADFKSIQDSYSYLSEGQKDAIERFLNHFRDKNSSLTVNLESKDEKDYKVKFLQIWDILYKLYTDFNEALSGKHMSYEGKVYREIAERLDRESVTDMLAERFPHSTSFVFVGLNALSECEKKLMGRMRDAGVAQFCWDYGTSMIKDPANKSSFFMADNVVRFPQAFKPDPEGYKDPEINVLSVPSSIGMAKQLPEILKRLGDGTPGIETAIVLPDEGLLLPVLNSIPGPVTDLNVTMGYPMGESEFWCLMNDVAALQMHLRLKDGEWYFYHRQVWAIFSNSVFKSVLTDAGRETVKNIKKGVKYYIPQSEFTGDPVLEAVFKPAVTDPAGTSPEAIQAIGCYLQDIITCIGPKLKTVDDMAVELDFARVYHQTVGYLRKTRLPLLPATYFRLLAQLVGGTSVPFRGEPLKGLQIMGPLETRALDFENVILLSCNEGMFPRRSVSSSFIPPELRKGFGLPTYEYQDAVWAYYFYRMIQRAGKVWMLFDSRAEGLRGGEESRYIKQLELHFGLPVHRFVVKAPVSRGSLDESIPKTQEQIDRLRAEGHLSATSMQHYLSCPAKFYYGSIEGLKEDDEVSESLDAGTLGTVFHNSMKELYSGKTDITAGYLDSLLKDGTAVRETVAGQIRQTLKTFDIEGRNIIFQEVVCEYVKKVLQRDRELMDRYGVGSFHIHSLEKPKDDVIGGFKFIGYLDRLDSFAPDHVRIVDYKTGKVTDEDFNITAANAQQVVEKLFGEKEQGRPKIALQLYLYDRFVARDSRYAGKEIVNSIYQTSRLFVREVEEVSLVPEFTELMDSALEEKLKELADTSVPWKRTEEVKTCEYCDFKMICGR